MKADHFRADLNPEEALALFRYSVEEIEVETTSYCNRVCSFCPNSFLDRRSEKKIMPEDTWEAILQGLRETQFSGRFVWSRYSEPLSERGILKRIGQVREAAPDCRICINSNGDYLDAKYLKELEDAGLNRLWLDVYLDDDLTYNVEVATKAHDKFSKRIGRPGKVTGTDPELEYEIESSVMDITSHVRNLSVMETKGMSDRGGLVQLARKTTRVSPCFAPFKHLVIDWDGSVMLCCHLRSDSPKHKEDVIGRIGQGGFGLVDAYVQIAPWRESLRGFGPKGGSCAGCNVSEYSPGPVTHALSGILSNTNSIAAGLVRSPLQKMFRKVKRY